MVLILLSSLYFTLHLHLVLLFTFYFLRWCLFYWAVLYSLQHIFFINFYYPHNQHEQYFTTLHLHEIVNSTLWLHSTVLFTMVLILLSSPYFTLHLHLRLHAWDSLQETPRKRLLARDSSQGTPHRRLLARDSGKRIHVSCKEYHARSLSLTRY